MGLKSRAARGGGGGEPQEDKAPRRPSILVPPTPPGEQDAVHHPRRWLRWDYGGAARADSRAAARPPPTPQPPAPCLPRPSPSSSRWMMLSMLSLSISAIASQRPGGPLPAAPLPPLAARPARLVSSFCLVFPLPPRSPSSLTLCPPPAPPSTAGLSRDPALNKMAAVSSASSAGAWILRARRGSPETLYRPGGKSGVGERHCDRPARAESFRSRKVK